MTLCGPVTRVLIANSREYLSRVEILWYFVLRLHARFFLRPDMQVTSLGCNSNDWAIRRGPLGMYFPSKSM
jgi:hypothetical protein